MSIAEGSIWESSFVQQILLCGSCLFLKDLFTNINQHGRIVSHHS